MERDNRGYIFESRRDDFGRKGYKESYELFNGVATVLIAFDKNMKINAPIYYTREAGYKLLEEDFPTEADLETFLRSRRGTYAVVRTFDYLIRARIEVETKRVKSLEIFVPIQDFTEKVNRGYGKIRVRTCGIFYKVGLTSGNGIYTVNKKSWDSRVEAFNKAIKDIDFSSKAKYLKSRYVGDKE